MWRSLGIGVAAGVGLVLANSMGLLAPFRGSEVIVGPVKGGG